VRTYRRKVGSEYKMSVETLKRKNHLDDLGVNDEYDIKINIKERGYV
jgi:hypothetical protein